MNTEGLQTHGGAGDSASKALGTSLEIPASCWAEEPSVAALMRELCPRLSDKPGGNEVSEPTVCAIWAGV